MNTKNASTDTRAALLPRMLSARDLTVILGSRALAYKLFNTKGFPVVELGKRKFVREDRFIKWIDDNEGQYVNLSQSAPSAYRSKGVQAYSTDFTSSVEAAVIRMK